MQHVAGIEKASGLAVRCAACTLAVQLLHVAPQSSPLLADAVGKLFFSVLTGLVQCFSATVPCLLLPIVISLKQKQEAINVQVFSFITCSKA